MPFKEAYKALLSGKKIRRKNFKGYWYLNQESGIIIVHCNDKDLTHGKLDLTIRNCAQDDWEIIEEEQ